MRLHPHKVVYPWVRIGRLENRSERKKALQSWLSCWRPQPPRARDIHVFPDKKCRSALFPQGGSHAQVSASTQSARLFRRAHSTYVEMGLSTKPGPSRRVFDTVSALECGAHKRCECRRLTASQTRPTTTSHLDECLKAPCHRTKVLHDPPTPIESDHPPHLRAVACPPLAATGLGGVGVAPLWRRRELARPPWFHAFEPALEFQPSLPAFPPKLVYRIPTIDGGAYHMMMGDKVKGGAGVLGNE